nr:hypothetical protein BaRGS_033547 [Batillaria attramentaria]
MQFRQALLGSAVFGVLLWLRLDFWTNEYLELDSSLDRYLILIYVSLVDGALILIFSIFGLIGGLRTIKWALVVLRDTVGNNDLIKEIVTQRYNGEPINKITRAVDIMQAELECCGGVGPTDYDLSNWQAAMPERKDTAPWSCCKDAQRYENMKYTCNIWELQSGEKGFNPEIHRTLICILVVSILIHVLNNLYVPQPDDIVYDMARNQEKSPYPSRGDYRDYYR